jgi:hypothetical protein
VNETGLFIAGTIVTGIVATGGFLYAMFSFGRWSDRSEAETMPRRTTSEEPNT